MECVGMNWNCLELITLSGGRKLVYIHLPRIKAQVSDPCTATILHLGNDIVSGGDRGTRFGPRYGLDMRDGQVENDAIFRTFLGCDYL